MVEIENLLLISIIKNILHAHTILLPLNRISIRVGVYNFVNFDHLYEASVPEAERDEHVILY